MTDPLASKAFAATPAPTYQKSSFHKTHIYGSLNIRTANSTLCVASMRKLTLRPHYTSPNPGQQWGLCPTIMANIPDIRPVAGDFNPNQA